MNEELDPSPADAPADVIGEVDVILTEALPEPETGPERPLVLSATVGLIVALALGVLWAGVAYVTDRELGLLAWAIGLGVGAAMAAVAGRRSTKLAVAAVLMSLVGLVAGKYLSTEVVLVRSVVDEILADPSFMEGFAYSTLVEQGKVDEDVQAWWSASEAGDVPPDELAERIALLESDIAATAEAAPEAEKRAWAEPIARSFIEEAPLVDRYSLGFYDLLWVLLAVVSAWGMTHPKSAAAS